MGIGRKWRIRGRQAGKEVRRAAKFCTQSWQTSIRTLPPLRGTNPSRASLQCTPLASIAIGERESLDHRPGARGVHRFRFSRQVVLQVTEALLTQVDDSCHIYIAHVQKEIGVGKSFSGKPAHRKMKENVWHRIGKRRYPSLISFIFVSLFYEQFIIILIQE